MSTYSLSHLSDHPLLRDLTALVAQDRATTARLLAHLAEVDARRLYLPAGYPSMYAYCVEELHLCEQAAFKRIRAARTARQFPAIFDAVADGRLHLSTVVLLTPYLTPETTDELLRAAAHKSKSEIEQLLAQRFPRPDTADAVTLLGSLTPLTEQLSPGTVESPTNEPLAARPVELSAPGGIGALRPKVAPLSPQRFALQLTIGQSTLDKLRYAQGLLSHQIPNGDLAEVLDRALDALILKLEKRKFAATTQPRHAQRHSTTGSRHVPARVRRAVWKRDGGQCTFVGTDGRRCSERSVEFDHIDEVARGGQATVEGIRLLCRAHNQYAAECTFGAEFMSRKRQEAQAARAARAAAEARQAAAKDKAREVIPWLRRLGIRAQDARQAAVLCEATPDAPIEQRVRVALSCFGPRTPSRGRVAPTSPGCGP